MSGTAREIGRAGSAFPVQSRRPSVRSLSGTALLQADCNSQVTAAHLRSWLPPGLLEVVPNGIDLSRFKARTELRSTARVVVTMVGNLTSRVKKHHLLIEAANRVSQVLPVEFRIYGHDPSRGGKVTGDDYVDELHARIRRYQLQEKVRFPGFVPDPAQVMAESDVLVHPADGESFGRIIVEAMASALPVVGVRGGGVGEIVEDGVTGLLATPDRPAELAACIERLVRNADLRRSMGISGRRRAEQYYSLEACVAGILGVYETAMARPLSARQAAGAACVAEPRAG